MRHDKDPVSADRVNRASGTQYNPANDLIFMALCHSELGNAERARQLLAESLSLLEDAELEFLEGETLRAFLEQARAQILPAEQHPASGD